MEIKKAKKNNRVRLSLYLPDLKFKHELESLADKDGRSVNKFIVRILAKELSIQKKVATGRRPR